MNLWKKSAEKDIIEEYCNLYCQWFNVKITKINNMDTKQLIKLIIEQYGEMDNNQKSIELIALKERIRVKKDDDKNSIENSFYTLCLDILNECMNNNANEESDCSNKKEAKENEDSLLVELGNWIFGTLEQLSIFNVVRKLKHKTSYKFVDLWVLGNLFGAILSTIIVYNLSSNNRLIISVILIYAILRVFEVVIYQINVLLFHPYRAKKKGEEYKIKSITRMIIALLNNYMEIMFWYDTMVMSIVLLNGGNTYEVSWLVYIRSNILCITTLDANIVKDTLKNSYSYLSDVVFVEIISGIIMTLISLARFIGALPEIESIDK